MGGAGQRHRRDLRHQPALQIAAGRWLLVCGYNVNGAKGLISRQVQFGNCHTSDNAAVSTSAKFLCS
jgi:hypothetical protein